MSSSRSAAQVLLHLSLRHPNIVGLLGCAYDVGRGEVCAVLELCGKGTLEQLLRATTPTLSWAAHKLPLAAGIARAMAYLHSHRAWAAKGTPAQRRHPAAQPRLGQVG